MLKRILLGALVVLLLVVVGVGALLRSAHRAIDAERAPLPAAADLAAFVDGPTFDLPVRARWIETATQATPRGAVLDPGGDPQPDAPYVMSHPAFVLQWTDGRILLVDAGMRRDSALSFGKPLEWLGGAGPIEPRQTAADALGADLAQVKGIVFTHLHSDHVDGTVELCAAQPPPAIGAFMTVAQAERPNHTTRPGLDLLDEATCVTRRPLGGAGPLHPVPGFPGVVVIDAGGHTPGSQIVLVRLASATGMRLLAFAGDTVNHHDGIRFDVPKPWAYRTFIVPESDERQQELRRFLGALERERGFTVLVSHDESSLLASGLAQ
ncbi:MAG: MBL fold metallo-hydrolase [Deltaproteobacteria bacterium]|nr:MBL fold metallo-hydrolase [Deltaproteobacteria bacterium]